MGIRWLCVIVISVSVASAATIDVTSTSNMIDPNDGACTLAEAIRAANDDAPSGPVAGECTAGEGADVVQLQAAASYILDWPYNGGPDGLPEITSDVEISGRDATIARDAMATLPFRILSVSELAVVTLDHVTIEGGESAPGSNRGGGIVNRGSLTLSSCRIVGNTTGGFGGGIANFGVLTISLSEIVENFAFVGGGLGNVGSMFGPPDAGTLTVTDSTIARNQGLFGGGGVFNDGGRSSQLPGRMTVLRSSISDNLANQGGGIWNHGEYEFFGGGSGEVSLVNTTMSGNMSVAAGGAIANFRGCFAVGCDRPTITLDSCTVTANKARFQWGGGIYNSSGAGTFRNTIIAGNLTDIPPTIVPNMQTDCASQTNSPIFFFDSEGSNVVGEDKGCPSDGPGDLTIDPEDVTDSLLGPLVDNGGPTRTHALLEGSIGIDAGSCDTGDQTLSDDQRGVPRPLDGDSDGLAECDMGAYERMPPVLSIEIDVKPDDFPNSVNPRGRGVIPVAILGSASFDVVDIDVSTLRFGPGSAVPAHDGHFSDVNADGWLDLVAHFRTADAEFACGDDAADLFGQTRAGQLLAGSDSIQTVGCAGPNVQHD